MTIEDPVEYRFPSINQIQINEQADITFANGLRSILRQDPDVILVGEIRDVETARIAVQSALTGHFVLSSLHATDAPAALHRFLDMGIESFLVASSVLGVVAQRLVRRICTHCRAPYEPTREELAFLTSMRGRPPDGRLPARARLQLLRPDRLPATASACTSCMFVTDAIRDLVVERATHEEMRKVARSEGMRTLGEEAAAARRVGRDNLAEVIRSIYVEGAEVARYEYVATGPDGRRTSGTPPASTRDAAEHALHQRDRRDVPVTEKRGARVEGRPVRGQAGRGHAPVPPAQRVRSRRTATHRGRAHAGRGVGQPESSQDHG